MSNFIVELDFGDGPVFVEEEYETEAEAAYNAYELYMELTVGEYEDDE